jgi:hypothetical protein
VLLCLVGVWWGGWRGREGREGTYVAILEV